MNLTATNISHIEPRPPTWNATISHEFCRISMVQFLHFKWGMVVETKSAISYLLLKLSYDLLAIELVIVAVNIWNVFS